MSPSALERARLPRSYRHTQDPSGSCRALWRIPRRSDDSERVGLNSIVRASRSSKLANDCGPSTKSVTALVFAAFTPGVMSTITSDATRAGWRTASSIAVIPPSDIPTTTRAFGASSATTTARSSAMFIGLYAPSARHPECPWPGRSTANVGRPRQSATVSHVCAFCAPPCTSTNSGVVSPQRSALTVRGPSPSAATTVSTRSTVGTSATVSANSEMFSWKRPNSS